MESLTISRNSSHVTTKKFLEPLDLNTLTPRRKRSADLDTMNHPKSKRARNEKGVDEELSKARPTKAAKRGQSKAALNETPSQRLDVYVFGSGESGELGLGHLKRNGKPPTNVKRPRLNDLLDAKTVGVVQLDVGGMRKSQFPDSSYVGLGSFISCRISKSNHLRRFLDLGIIQVLSLRVRTNDERDSRRLQMRTTFAVFREIVQHFIINLEKKTNPRFWILDTVALTHDNKIITWGVNDQGALGRDTTVSGLVISYLIDQISRSL
jgi:alpha-tubulin suppressor-like RCC1 family protein